VEGRRTRFAARLAGISAALVLAGVSAAAASGPADSLQNDVSSLKARTQHALLDLYAIDTRLHTAQTRLASLRTEAAHVRLQQRLLREQLSATEQTLKVSQHQLGMNLRLLYKQGDVSALAVVLGAQNLDDAVTKLDALNRVADESQAVVQTTSAAKIRLARLRSTLLERRTTLNASVRDAASVANTLASARANRLSFISRLQTQARLKAAQIDALQRTAIRVEHKSNEIQAAAATTTALTDPPVPTSPATPSPTTPSPATPSPASGGRTLTVSSTGYSLPGHTATGIPVGWGVIAVDPSVIPLGTRLSVPGYGEGVAADTGSAVRGADIDLWFPTLAQARAWGRRTVTITLH
jgi:3D (Asp-Asp-Asp) domain-containing protein